MYIPQFQSNSLSLNFKKKLTEKLNLNIHTYGLKIMKSGKKKYK